MADRDDIGQPGYVYLVCFAATPLSHAKHYLGATGLELQDRLAAHRGERLAIVDGKRPGRPARILAALHLNGGRFDLVRSWRTPDRESAFELERRLKGTGRASGAFCPWCHTHEADEASDGAKRLSKAQRRLCAEEWLYTIDGKAIMVPWETFARESLGP